MPTANRINRSAKSAKHLRDTDGNLIHIDDGSTKTGTKLANASFTIRLVPRSNNDSAWIYLSAFHPSTSESQIASFVIECLELVADVDLKVVKLVRRGKT